MRHKAMNILVSLILATFILLAFPAERAGAETVLEKISRTGKFTAGTSTISIPFAYINDKKEWGGFSVDLIKEIHRRLERKLLKEITLELKEVAPTTRIPMVASRTIDIECGSTTYTRSRDETVDFSINFFFTGSQLLVKKGSLINSLRDLAGKRVGATEGTTNAKIIQAKEPEAQLVLFQDHRQGFLALQQGKIDAYSTDGIVLAGLVATTPTSADFLVVGFFSKEPYSCIVPENDSRWRDFVNHTLMELIENGRYFELYDKWFGDKGVVPYPMPSVVKLYILFQVMPE
ncbi:MAG: transporter substrate-binding domain-containing protein [candidate division NC10 bacterium]|nr:transporter substrate-binding domain-containing protein [candidate division NC10 bacterium]